jgi:alpha-1,3-mannosyltransferase
MLLHMTIRESSSEVEFDGGATADMARSSPCIATKRCREATTKRMKILHVVRQFEPSVGGLETYVRELALRQSAENDVSILTLDRLFGNGERLFTDDELAGIPITRIPFFGFRRFFVPVLPARRLRGIDIVHVHAVDQFVDLLALYSRVLPLNLFVTTHGLFFHTEVLMGVKRFYLHHITKRSLRRAKAVFAVSGVDQSTLRSVGVASVLMRNPIVPLGNFLSAGRDLVYIGRLSENKRVDRLIAFMAELHARGDRRKLHIVGSDQEGLWPGLRALAERLLMAGLVEYHGFLEPDRLSELLKTCGFIVSASRYEGFGLSIVEGMSVGLLPIMHDNAAFRETHALSGSGLITDFDEPKRAAGDFLTYAEEVRQQDRDEAATFARAQSWDSLVDRLQEAYAAALG